MSEDIPMRERRGQLRAWNYTFKGDHSSYSFEETMHIAQSNVIPPDSQPIPEPVEIQIATELLEDQAYLYGRSDRFGLQIIKKKGTILIFPRMCPHEGACLDGQKIKSESRIHCPWHGRVFKPTFQIDLSGGDTTLRNQQHLIKLTGGVLQIRTIS